MLIHINKSIVLIDFDIWLRELKNRMTYDTYIRNNYRKFFGLCETILIKENIESDGLRHGSEVWWFQL